MRKQAGKHIFASHPMHELRKCDPCAWWESHFWKTGQKTRKLAREVQIAWISEMWSLRWVGDTVLKNSTTKQTGLGSPRFMNFGNVIPTLGGNDSFENNKQHEQPPGQSHVQKRKNHVEILRKRVFMTFLPQRGRKNRFWHSHRAQESIKIMLPTEHGDHISGICNPSNAKTSNV